jgi:hypothetical protein
MKSAKKLNILRFAQFQALLFALVGFALGIVYSFGGLGIDVLVTLGWITTTETPGLSEGTLLAFGALLGMPIIAAGCGFSLGLVEAFLYNSVARWMRDSEIELFE